MPMRRSAIVLSALLLQGFGILPVPCTDQLVYGIVVTATDSATGELLNSELAEC